ncbi:MAG: transglutaminase family protein [Alphaproteobacteria bacterium]|nr:transglutaminase family protein [Alphaproteobacteria bacterium]
MSVLVSLHHVTRYSYDRPVALGPQVVRLRPAPHGRTRITSYSQKVVPAAHHVNWQNDPHGNSVARYTFAEKTSEFAVIIDLHADLAVVNPFDFFIEAYAATYPFALPPDLAADLGGYLDLEPLGSRMRAFMAEVPRGPIGTVQFLVDLNNRVQRAVRYVVRMETGTRTPEETLEAGSGSCRDSAWLMVQALRHLGLPARFVSGYLIQLKPDVPSRDSPDHDSADLHAWAEVFVPGAGWIGLDPTSGLFAGEGHIPLVATPHYRSAAPITGTVEPAEAKLTFEMSVTRGADRPRVTNPFSEEAWHKLDALGEAVDRDLIAGDVRLTMGGEPTFVSLDDYQSPEWTVAALGAEKRKRADTLIRKLRARFAPQGLLHYGLGKWYPGEAMPRWAFTLYWRRDGRPLWADADLIAAEGDTAKAGVEEAQRFAETLAKKLGLAKTRVQAAYEDTAHWLLEEDKLPRNVTPDDPKLFDPAARARMVRTFAKGLGVPAAFVLPLRRDGATWLSEAWQTRRGHLFLLPGDLPAGARLPLGTLPHVEPADFPYVNPTDPMDEKAALPADNSAPAHTHDKNKDKPVRTALSIEPRDGRLCVFMPLVASLEDYVALVGAVEATAAQLKLPVHLEGNVPPVDPRLDFIKLTPDPGVLEINLHPARSWRELADIAQGLYADARATRLGTEKFMRDGRETGTGGGSHIVAGGATPAESPFLRRPDLLKSAVLYWQRHPSLSYLFSGVFIGPTSQSPRVDEARHEQLYELEIALAQVPKAGEDARPWLVDRLFRNLLVDVTGNTHRAEICVDKLFSPDSPTGRLGLVEFRAFEMAPDARMSLAQQLLVRALIAWFWREPQDGACVRWGTALHDRFMLPHFVWEDFLGVLDDLARAGYQFDPAWFAAQREFRFPFHGAVEHGGVRLELRHALEPWHVLGEETLSGATSRPADSSLERLQVRVQGFNAERHAIACNGRRVPLVSTGRSGEYVAGVRFKAWMLPVSLHPNLPVNAPLTFDIIDTWSRRSLGGGVYHARHPGGQSQDSYPVNASEAEARRAARFQDFDHTPGFIDIPAEERPAEFPATLDPRRAASL